MEGSSNDYLVLDLPPVVRPLQCQSGATLGGRFVRRGAEWVVPKAILPAPCIVTSPRLFIANASDRYLEPTEAAHLHES